MSVKKIDIGSIPAYEIGEKTAPAVIVLQVAVASHWVETRKAAVKSVPLLNHAVLWLRLQEWWGVTPDLKEIATEISKRKYRALIPDLYKGKVGVEVEEAKHVSAMVLIVQQLRGGMICFVKQSLAQSY